MKKLILFCFCLSLFIHTNAQDLLITNGDSLNCKITKENKDYIYFTFKHKNEVRSTLIERNKVTDYKYNFYSQPEVSENEVLEIRQKTHNPLRFALSGGWGYRTADLAEEATSYKNYYNGLRSGFQIGADACYYFNDYYGAGFKYLLFKASTEGQTNFGYSKENTSTMFIGPEFATRFFNNSKKNAVILNLALGYLRYKDDGFVNNENGTITSDTFGMVMDLGYDIGISKNLAVGFQVSLIGGSFSDYTLEKSGHSQKMTLPDKQRESLSRIDLSVGIRFNVN